MKITKRQLRRIIKEEKSRLIEGQLMYHSTDSKNVGSIQQDGLVVGRESSHTLGGSWADSYYGTRPIYLSVEKGKYAGTPLTVDTSGLALAADLPSLVDTGAYQEEEGMYWDEGSEPAQMIDIVDEDGMVYFDDLLSPGSAASEAAIEITGTAAVLENIPPNRIQLTERRHGRITKRQLRRIIKEEKSRLDEGVLEDIFGKKVKSLSDVTTVGDFKKLIKYAQSSKRAELGKEAAKEWAKSSLYDETIGAIPGMSTAKNAADALKSMYELPDEARTGTALDHMDVDDDVAKIVDDPIENAFLDELANEIDGMDDSVLMSNLNVTKGLQNYLEDKFNSRTVSGIPEGKRIKITKRQLRRIIREGNSRLLKEGSPQAPQKLKLADLVRAVDYESDGRGGGFKPVVGKQVGTVIEIDEDPDYPTQYTVLFPDGTTIMDDLGPSDEQRFQLVNENKMKITKRQLRQIIEGYNSMSDSGKALAQRAKRQFAKDYPSVKVGIDTREGWLTVDGKKAVNMSQASGSPMELEDVVDKMKQAYLGHPMAESSKSTIKYNADDALKGDQTKLPDKLQKGIIDAEEDEEKVEEGNLTEKQIRILVREIAASVAHPRDNLGKNIADVDFPIVVGYDLNGQMQSEIAYSQDELDEILDYLAPLGGGKGVPYSLDSLSDMEPQDRPVGAEIEQLAAGKIIVTKSQLRKLIREAGLWDNVHAKRKEGRPAAKKGEMGYPDEKSWKAAQEADDSDEQPLEEAENPCWDGYGPGAKSGKKTKKGKGGKRVPNCELQEDDEETLEEAMLYHIDAGAGVDQNVYRPGSTAFFALFREARRQFYEGTYKPKSEDEYELLEDLDIGEFALYEGVWVPLDYPIMEGNEEHLNEAEYQGKKVELNKPIRGGDGAYVYVNSGKKDKDGKIKVKKVSFGSSMPDAMGDNEAHRKRRKSYGDRHNCSDKDDKTKAGYWSCRATKFFGRDISGWW